MSAGTEGALHPTKQRLLEQGLAMLLERGYNDLGIQALLEATGTPKGSFYHHFRDKEDFALQAVEAYMNEVHAGLDHCLSDRSRSPLARVRLFFEMTQKKYKSEGYLGCFLGALGQELSGVSDVFRKKIDGCFSVIASRIASCLEEGKSTREVPPDTDTKRVAALLVDCWEGAALRSRLRGNPGPLRAMLDFYFSAAFAAPSSRSRARRAKR